MHEAITRAAVADLTGVKKRSTAYGIFNTVFGVAMLAGGAVLGYLYDLSAAMLAEFVVAIEVAAFLAILAWLGRRGKAGGVKKANSPSWHSSLEERHQTERE